MAPVPLCSIGVGMRVKLDRIGKGWKPRAGRISKIDVSKKTVIVDYTERPRRRRSDQMSFETLKRLNPHITTRYLSPRAGNPETAKLKNGNRLDMCIVCGYKFTGRKYKGSAKKTPRSGHVLMMHIYMQVDPYKRYDVCKSCANHLNRVEEKKIFTNHELIIRGVADEDGNRTFANVYFGDEGKALQLKTEFFQTRGLGEYSGVGVTDLRLRFEQMSTPLFACDMYIGQVHEMFTGEHWAQGQLTLNMLDAYIAMLISEHKAARPNIEFLSTLVVGSSTAPPAPPEFILQKRLHPRTTPNRDSIIFCPQMLENHYYLTVINVAEKQIRVFDPCWGLIHEENRIIQLNRLVKLLFNESIEDIDYEMLMEARRVHGSEREAIYANYLAGWRVSNIRNIIQQGVNTVYCGTLVAYFAQNILEQREDKLWVEDNVVLEAPDNDKFSRERMVKETKSLMMKYKLKVFTKLLSTTVIGRRILDALSL